MVIKAMEGHNLSIERSSTASRNRDSQIGCRNNTCARENYRKRRPTMKYLVSSRTFEDEIE